VDERDGKLLSVAAGTPEYRHLWSDARFEKILRMMKLDHLGIPAAASLYPIGTEGDARTAGSRTIDIR
jgi:hypothetical protein